MPKLMTAEEMLLELVSIDSPSGNEAAAAEFLVRQMQLLGFEAYRDEAGNAIAHKRSGQADGHATRAIALLGHIDTYPGRVPVRVEDGKIYGRGSVDAKGCLVTFVMAAAEAALQPGVELTIAAAVEEESATSRGARHLIPRLKPSFCIIGEPSGWDGVTIGYKGRLLVHFRTTISESHSAGPESTAAEKAVQWWNWLSEYANSFNRKRTRLFDQLLPSLRRVQTTSDGLQCTVEALVGFRLPPNFDLEQLQAELIRQAEGAELDFYGYERAVESGRNNPLASTFVRVLRAHGAEPRFKLKTGTSDMNVVAPHWNCPILAYGPGDSRLDHTPDEHLHVSELHHAIRILRDVLEVL